MTRSPATPASTVLLWVALSAAPVAGQRPVRLGGHLALGAWSSDQAAAAGGGLSLWWTRTPTVAAGVEVRLLGLRPTELRVRGPDGVTFGERSHRRVGAVTLAARHRFAGSGRVGGFAAAGTGMYVQWRDTEFWTEPETPDRPPRRSTTADETFGVNLGGGLLLGRSTGATVGVDLRGHLVLGGGSLLHGLVTASLGVEW